MATPSGGSKFLAVTVGARWVNGLSGLRFVKRWAVAAFVVASSRREARFGELTRLVEVGRSGFGFQRLALSMLGVS